MYIIRSDESDFAAAELLTIIRTCCKPDGEISNYKQFVSHRTLNIYDVAGRLTR